MYKLIIKFIIIAIIFLSVGAITSYVYLGNDQNAFAKLSPEQMHQKISSDREYAISLAKERGEYKCCIHPECTMCYDSPNKWNYQQEGKCYCDEFIARGEEPCPQCKKGLNCDSQNLDDTAL
jgi:hypothetical protein